MAANDLPIIYVDCPKDGEKAKIKIPEGGAKVVFRGDPGAKVKMSPQPAPAPKTKTVRVVRGGGVIYSAPTVQVIETNGTSTANGQVVVVQQRPVVVRDPYMYGYPYYGGYGCYGYYGYPYGYRRGFYY